MDAIDDRLLSFVHDNQWKVLKRNNLSRDEVRVLQIRSVKDRTDKAFFTTEALQSLATCILLTGKPWPRFQAFYILKHLIGSTIG